MEANNIGIHLHVRLTVTVPPTSHPLANKISDSSNLCPSKLSHDCLGLGLEHKLTLYADDLLLYTSNIPLSQLPSPLSHPLGAYQAVNWNMILAHSNPTYLGVHVTNRFENLFQANFTPLLTHTKDHLECWSLLHLSSVTRINSIKMNSLPKFLS